MAGVDESRLRTWLAKVSSFLFKSSWSNQDPQYHNPEAALRDITTVVNHYQGLVPTQEPYSKYLPKEQ